MPTGKTPVFKIEHSGQDITAAFNDRTTDLQVELHSGNGMPDSFRITVDDRDWRVAEPQLGEKLSIYLGYAETGMAFMGLFEINEAHYLGPPRSILLTGLAAGMTSALKSQQIQEFEEPSVADLINHIAETGGVTARIDPELGALKMPYRNQTNISGFHLLQDLERQFGAVAKFANGELIFMKRDAGATLSGITTTVILRPWHLAEWSVKHTQRPDYGEVRCSWRDKVSHDLRWESVRKPGSTAPAYQIGRAFNSQMEAQQYARARVEQLTRSCGEAELILSKGDPWIRDQMPAVISGMRTGIDGSYIIDSATHAYQKGSGISTTLIAKPPGTGADYSDQASGDTFSPMDGETA